LVRLLADGNIEYYNRIDNQVKVRGFRIELGEIEAALEGHPAINRAVAKVHDYGNGDNRLIAYYTKDDSIQLEYQELRTFLQGFLPEYMIPQHLVSMEVFPLTPAGKVDKKILPLPDATAQRNASENIPPSDEIEQTILEKWQRALNRSEPISVLDNFFALGGHSLLATQIITGIKKELSALITLRDFFEHPTIRGIAELIKKKDAAITTDASLTIRKRTDSSTAPLSLQQRRLWYLEKLNGESLAYNLPGRRRIKGPLDINLLEKCLNQIIKRHEVLRTRIKDIESYAVQEIIPSYDFKLPITDLSHLPLEQAEKIYQDDLMGKVYQPFNLFEASLIRMHLYKLAEQDHVFFFMPHHIIWDGWSFDIFHNELNLLYTAAVNDVAAELPDLPVQYGDYAQWQMEWLQSGALDPQVAYWKEKLGGGLPILELNTDYPRSAVQKYENGNTIFFNIERNLTDKLTEDAQQYGATFFMVLLAAFTMLLHRFTGGQRDILVGTPISGRNFSEINNLLGFFVNTLVLRSEVDPEMTYTAFLAQIKQTCLEGFSNQETPFERIVEVLNPVRDLSRSPIFQAVFAYQDVRNRKMDFAGMTYQQINIVRPGAQTDVDYWVRLSDKGIAGGFDYNRDLFKDSTMERMVACYQTIIRRIAENPNAKIRELVLIPENEYQLLVRTWNDTEMEYPEDKCVHELFSIEAGKNADKIAVEFENQSITYAELEQRADLLSGYLIRKGVQCGDLVGIHMDRCIEMVVAMLGILKAGAGYVPLDPDYPAERIQYMMQDAGIRVLLTQSHLAPPLDESAIQPIFLDTQWPHLAGGKDEASHGMPTGNGKKPGPESIAYVLYTSGSTGKPKGVEIPHRGLVNFLMTMSRTPGIGAEDTLLAVTTLSFDIAGLELFLPLLNGAKVIIASRELASDAHSLMKVLEAKEITMMQATPSTWRMLLVSGWEGSSRLKILCGGEAFPKDLAKSLVAGCKEVWNMYGPTETTIWSTCYRITDPEQPILVGRPIGNTQAFILDGNLEPVPIGVPGELYLGGDGVALGYHNRPDLTEKAFVRSPFAQLFKRPTIYKTGDLCRYHADGNIEYLHRIDTQVKVRGFRIELGEIENRLEEHESVKQAIAVVKELAPGDARIAAYIVPQDGEEIIGTELRQHLRDNLPDYMIPQYFIEEQSFPLTPAGKIDRKLLTSRFQVGGIHDEDQIIEPVSDSEQYLASLWKEILRIDEVSTHHNFFNIGGHSLLAMQVIARIAKDTGVQVSPRDMLLNTLGQIASQYAFQRSEPSAEEKSKSGIMESLKSAFIKKNFSSH